MPRSTATWQKCPALQTPRVASECAGKGSNSCTLSKTEFLTFMNTELAAFTKNQKDPGVLDLMMKKLDLSCDGQLDLQEFLNLIGSMEVACHDSFSCSLGASL
uniref:EF-hand domain-containing protein n=1 Tax=Myotis lucifugus TaxID=59463 RepID=G1QFE2_MYOLU